MTTTRRRIYRVPHALMMRIFTLAGVAQTIQAGQAVVLPKPLNIPDGAKVCSVQSNYAANCFDFVVEHETFAEVSECVELPVVRMELHLLRWTKPASATRRRLIRNL